MYVVEQKEKNIAKRREEDKEEHCDFVKITFMNISHILHQMKSTKVQTLGVTAAVYTLYVMR